jgi:stage V sporulation protein SpoVS
MLSTFVVTAVEIGAIGAACDVAQTATETTAVTAIAIGNRFMLSSLDKYLLPNFIVLLRR